MNKRASFGLLVVVVATVAIPAAARGGETGASEAIVFERKGDLYAVAVDGSRIVQLTKTRSIELEPAVSPDGSAIAYRRARDSRRSRGQYGFPGHGYELWTTSVDGGRRMRLTHGEDFRPAWSPDGETIFFSRHVPLGKFGIEDCALIFRVGSDGRDVRRVTPMDRETGHLHYDAAVSPDGRRIAFTQMKPCEGDYSFGLRVVDTSGRQTSDLARLPGNARLYVFPYYANPTWSPDGTRIAFQRNGGVYVAYRDGSGLRRVTPTRIGAWEPAWSPDGVWIAFVRPGGHGDLYVIHPDGTGLRQLTWTKADESSPSWLSRMPTG
jgi:Tol biopolymer transport system component